MIRRDKLSGCQAARGMPLSPRATRERLRHGLFVGLLLLASSALGLTARAAIAPHEAAGTWDGEVAIPGQALHVVVHLEGDGTLRGRIDIPQQGAKGLALDNVIAEGERIGFRIAGVPGEPTFDGRIDGDVIAGGFVQSGQRFPFELRRRTGAHAAGRRPQDPVPPFPYTIEDVTIRSGAITLAGTLTRPSGGGAHPALVLLTGSGPQNRDSEVFDHRPFHVLADHLTRAGVAVLRFDDRGVGQSGGRYDTALKGDFVADARACAAFLRERDDVSAVGLLGHSEGGDVAAAAAAQDDDIAFLILLASPGVAGHELMVEQNRLIALSMGATAEQSQAIADRARELFDAALDDARASEVTARTKALMEAQTGAPLPPEAQGELEQQAAMLMSPKFLELLRHDPRRDLARVGVPVLAVTGEKDVQVSPSQNLPAIEAALKDAGNGDVTIREIPDANHLLQPAENGGFHEYAAIEQTFDGAVLDLLRDWILARFAATPARR